MFLDNYDIIVNPLTTFDGRFEGDTQSDWNTETVPKVWPGVGAERQMHRICKE